PSPSTGGRLLLDEVCRKRGRTRIKHGLIGTDSPKSCFLRFIPGDQNAPTLPYGNCLGKDRKNDRKNLTVYYEIDIIR
ncbi:MAG: hypothetical protein Q4B72_15325, partial [Lachnospiraceae bacterium]|nr:hypothetical protein [Lachnospiraceae bacterium]